MTLIDEAAAKLEAAFERYQHEVDGVGRLLQRAVSQDPKNLGRVGTVIALAHDRRPVLPALAPLTQPARVTENASVPDVRYADDGTNSEAFEEPAVRRRKR